MLPAFLQGPATTYFESLTEDQKATYDALVASLNECFGPDINFPTCVQVKKEFISVNKGGEKKHFQKRLLLLKLQELHVEVIKRFGTKISLSKFGKLRPKWCIPVGGASGLHAVYVCEYQNKVKLLASQIPGVLEKVVCDTANHTCMLHGCDNCPGSSALKEYLKELFEEHSNDHVNFK